MNMIGLVEIQDEMAKLRRERDDARRERDALLAMLTYQEEDGRCWRRSVGEVTGGCYFDWSSAAEAVLAEATKKAVAGT